MDGENNGNPYFLIGVFPPIFGNTHIISYDVYCLCKNYTNSSSIHGFDSFDLADAFRRWVAPSQTTNSSLKLGVSHPDWVMDEDG